jgi:hypothetical protein
MRVRQIDPGVAADVARFVRFPAELYRRCPQWCPRWEPSVRLNLDRQRHPFYEHSTADFFVAEDGGRVVGRIAALDNRHYNEYRGKQTGFFHYFEVVDDFAVAEALFAALRDWMRGRGLSEILGPYGLLKLDGGGVLVEGFDESAAMGIAYNYPYYDAFLRRAGFVKHEDFLSGRLDRGHHLAGRLFDISEKAKTRYGFSLKTFTSKAELARWAPAIAEVYEQSFVDHLDYYPRTPAERKWLMEEMLAVAEPRLVKLVMCGERVAGFLLAFPDWRDGLRRSGGRLWPLGWYHLWQARRRQDWCQISQMGLLPEFRRRGANALLYTEIERTLCESGYEHAEVSLNAEDNRLSVADRDAVGVRWHKRHRVYRCVV